MSSGFHLLSGSPALTTMHLQRTLVRLAVHGRIRWLVCGNYLDLQRLIYAVAVHAGANYHGVLENNIAIARAETCHQIAALLRKTEAAETPTFVSDLLLHFQDEKVRDNEAGELFFESLQALKQLSQGGPVIVSASGGGKRPQFHSALLQHAKRIIQFGEEAQHGS
jgi:hypothetical protein